MKRLPLIFGLAFLIRIIIAPIYHHGDADTYFFWAKYLWGKKDFLFFLGKAVPNAMSALYPPLFYYLLFLWRGLYELLGSMIWFLNVKISIFPSNLILLYQSYNFGVTFNKIPAILADLGLGLLIYKIGSRLGTKKLAFLTTIFYLFLPATWYNSAYWGQIESLYCFFVILGFFLVLKEKFLWAIVSISFSALIKPTGLFIFPALLVYFLKKKEFLDLLVGGIIFLLIALILYFPFQPINTLPWALRFYLSSFSGEISQLTANAFNFWALIFGFGKKDTVLFLNFPAKYVGWGIFIVSVLIVCIRLWQSKQKKSLFVASFLIAFSAFLFLPLMHERYFYTALVFSAILGSFKKEWLYCFIMLSVIHFFNLYHFWWSPRIPFLVSFLSNLIVIRGIIIVNLIIFVYFLIHFLQDGSFDNNS